MLKNTRETPFDQSGIDALICISVVLGFQNTSFYFSFLHFPRFYVSSSKIKKRMITVKLICASNSIAHKVKSFLIIIY